MDGRIVRSQVGFSRGMPAPSLWPWPLVALLLLSGCAATSSDVGPVKDPGETGPAPTPQVNETFGSVTGIIVDLESLPVKGARVGLLPAAFEAKTDETGTFTFNSVPPGTQNLVVDALGFEQARRIVRVVAGEVAEVKVELEAIVFVDPHMTLHPGSVYIVLGASDFHRTTAVNGIACDPCEAWFHHEPAPTNALFEPVWTRSISVPHINEIFYFGLRANAYNGSIIATGDTVWAGNLASRQAYHLSQEEVERWGPEADFTMAFVNTSPTMTIAVNQRIDFWLSLAYAQAIPAGFSALPPE